MAIAFVSENDTQAPGVQQGVVSLSVTAGNLLVLCAAIRDGFAVSSVTDDQSQTWTLAASNAGSRWVAQYYCQNTYTGTLTVTAALADYDTPFLWLSQYSHGGAPTPVDTSTATNSAVTSHPMATSGSGLDAVSGDLIVGVAGQSSSISDETPPTGYTAGSFNGTNGRQYWVRRDVGSTLTGESVTYTASSHDSDTVAVTYREAGSPVSAYDLLRSVLRGNLRGAIQ